MSAAIISVFAQKGGVGKTMTTMQLAGTLGSLGLKVFVADLDPQNTAALWFHEAIDIPFPAEVMSLAPMKERFINKLTAIGKTHDVILVDLPPSLDSTVPWASLLISDLVIIPVAPVMDNIWAAKQAEELVEKARVENPALQGVYLLSMMRRGKIFEQCLNTLIAKAKLPILKSRISMRNAYPESQIFGCIVSSFGKSVATDEVLAMTLEVAKLLKLKINKGGSK